MEKLGIGTQAKFNPKLVWAPKIRTTRDLEEIFFQNLSAIKNGSSPYSISSTNRDFEYLETSFILSLKAIFDGKETRNSIFHDQNFTDVLVNFLDDSLSEKGPLDHFNFSNFEMVLKTVQKIFEFNSLLWGHFPSEIKSLEHLGAQIFKPLFILMMRYFRSEENFLSYSEIYLKNVQDLLNLESWRSSLFSHYCSKIFAKSMIWKNFDLSFDDEDFIQLEEETDYTCFIFLALKTLLLNENSEKFVERAGIADFFKDISLGNFLGFDFYKINHRDWDQLHHLVNSSKMIIENYHGFNGFSIETIKTILDC